MRTLRTTIVILLFLSLLVLSLVGALTLYATPERVTARAAAMLESHLGLRAELSGDVELKRLPKLILRIPAGELIRAKDSAHAGRFASAEIELAPWSLFAQSPRVDRVAVDRLELNDISYAKLLENTTSSAEHALWNIDQLELRHPFVLMLCRMLAQVCSQRSMPNFPIALKPAERCVWRVR